MTAPLEPAEIAALLSLPPRGDASLADLVVDARLKPSDLQRALRQLIGRELVSSTKDQQYRLTGLGRATCRSLESAGPGPLSAIAARLNAQESEVPAAARRDADAELDARLGPLEIPEQQERPSL